MSVVIVTGCNGGIGSEISKELISSGKKVLGIDIQDKTDLNIEYLQFDLSKIDPVNGLDVSELTTKLNQMGGVDALINNAAYQYISSIEDAEASEIIKSFNINLFSPFMLVQACIPLFNERASIINITSIHSQQSKQGFSVYASSKGGLETLTRSMAVELGDRFKVCAIKPAAIDTPMLREGFESNPDSFKELEDCHPTKSIGSPSEIAHLVEFIIDSKYDFITGSVIELTGGISSRLHDPL